VGSLESRRTAIEFAKVLAASIVAADAMLAVVAVTEAVAGPGDLRSLVELVLAGLAGLGAFLVAARWLEVEDLELFERLLPGRS
jgi:hypothetical protein